LERTEKKLQNKKDPVKEKRLQMDEDNFAHRKGKQGLVGSHGGEAVERELGGGDSGRRN